MSWLFEDGAKQHAQTMFGKSLESLLNSYGNLMVLNGKCDNEEKQNAIARVIATNVKIEGFSGKIYLGNNRITDVSKIGEALKTNNTLTWLSLSDNQITDVSKIGEALKTNKTLTTLYLGFNQITDVSKIAEALKTNKTLTTLGLFRNQITDVSKIEEALKTNTTLTELNLRNNRITETGKQSIRKIWNQGNRCFIGL